MATSAVVHIGSSEVRLAFGMNRSGRVSARVRAGVISRGMAFNRSRRRMVPPVFFVSNLRRWSRHGKYLEAPPARAAQFPIERALLTDISDMSGFLGRTIPTPPRVRQ